MAACLVGRIIAAVPPVCVPSFSQPIKHPWYRCLPNLVHWIGHTSHHHTHTHQSIPHHHHTHAHQSTPHHHHTHTHRAPTAPNRAHPAGAVTYKTDNFLSKNRDFVVAEHQQLLGASQLPFVAALFPPEADTPAARGGGAQSSYKFSSVGSRFKRQLGELMVALHRMEPHYIRCIKPNSFNRPMDFENLNVLHQVGGWEGGWIRWDGEESTLLCCTVLRGWVRTGVAGWGGRGGLLCCVLLSLMCVSYGSMPAIGASQLLVSFGVMICGRSPHPTPPYAAIHPFILCLGLPPPALPAIPPPQLRCGGVLEAVRISCAGYPTKMPFLDFIDHFWMLALDSSQQLDDRDFVQLVLRRVLREEGWQLGKTKVGWRAGVAGVVTS